MVAFECGRSAIPNQMRFRTAARKWDYEDVLSKGKTTKRWNSVGFKLHQITGANHSALHHGSVSAHARLIVARGGF